MKLINVFHYLILSTILLLSVSLNAETSDNTKKQIDSACLRQAVALVNQLKTGMYTDMDSSQSNKIVKMATSSCRKQFNQATTKQSVSEELAKNEEASEEEDSSGSILDILTKKVERKEGNKRLTNHKR